MKRPFLFSVTYGRRINTGGNENADLFGRQRPTHSDLSFRCTTFLCRHWGVFGEIIIGGSDDWAPPFGSKWERDFECGIGIEAAVLSAGIMYRSEWGRWQLFARAGYGCAALGHGKYYNVIDYDCYEPSLIDELSMTWEHEWEVYRFVGCNFVGLGLTLGYRTSRVTSLLFDVAYRYPVKSCSEITVQNFHMDGRDISTEWSNVSSRSWGNNLTVSVGIQFQCELSGTRKKAVKK